MADVLELFPVSDRAKKFYHEAVSFVNDVCVPAERVFNEQLSAQRTRWSDYPAVMEDLKREAKKRGLWNLWLPDARYGAGLTNLDYAVICEVLGRSALAPEACNCSAPDTGNMEVLFRYGTEAQKKQWLEPLIKGEIRSAFCMTEVEVASSDATNICTSIRRDGDSYVINGRKWWASGAGDPRCKVYIVMGKSDESQPRHRQQSMILCPADAPGVTVVRPLNVFGYDDAPHGHCEIIFKNVRVPASNILLGEGRGFEIAQGRLGPGRIHHCMRTIGITERCLELMIARIVSRTAFGKRLAQQGSILQDIAMSRIEIDQARLLTLKAAYKMDREGNKAARADIAMIKVAAPNMSLRVIDRAIQAHGACGVCQDTILASTYAHMRTLRIADGPDEVHLLDIARRELKKPLSGEQVLHTELPTSTRPKL